MKLNNLKSQFLKYMVKSYAKDHKRVFTFESFKSLYPELDDDFISDALFTLDEDGLSMCLKLTMSLTKPLYFQMPSVLLRKGYSFIKEIRSWI